MKLTEKIKAFGIDRAITGVSAVAMTILSIVNVVPYLKLGETVSSVTMVALNAMFILCAWCAFFGRVPAVNVLICGFSFVLNSMSNFSGFYSNPIYVYFIVFSGVSAIAGTVFTVKDKIKPTRVAAVLLAAMIAVSGVFCGIWAIGNIGSATRREARKEIWQVPDRFENAKNEQKGSVEKVTYATKAYGTDSRPVTKAAYVYLPYGYSETEKYDILYLMHGTGDDEAYWLVKNEWNKTMLDNLIEQKIIKPVIVVTPTFYVENDCADDLDKLTYSFRDELRNDLMPVVESRYSTYADSIDEAGFTASRLHRAFAGLSRGSVTTLHSAFCGSLDYFSSFGTFSGSRTTPEYFIEHVQSDAFKNYSIENWHVYSGNFDFALTGQLTDYPASVAAEPRLQPGKNTTLTVFPMRYHSQGNWHLALYNFLLEVYGK